MNEKACGVLYAFAMECKAYFARELWNKNIC